LKKKLVTLILIGNVDKRKVFNALTEIINVRSNDVIFIYVISEISDMVKIAKEITSITWNNKVIVVAGLRNEIKKYLKTLNIIFYSKILNQIFLIL